MVDSRLRTGYDTVMRDWRIMADLWNSSLDMAEACASWNLAPRAATALACRMRRKGWDLKKFPAGRERIQPPDSVVSLSDCLADTTGIHPVWGPSHEHL